MSTATELGGAAGIVRQVWRKGSGAPYAVTLAMSDGATATVRLSDGRLSGADLRVWRDLAAYGFERWFCPGHGASRVCPYGAHDYVRMTGGAPRIDPDSL